MALFLQQEIVLVAVQGFLVANQAQNSAADTAQNQAHHDGADAGTYLYAHLAGDDDGEQATANRFIR